MMTTPRIFLTLLLAAALLLSACQDETTTDSKEDQDTTQQDTSEVSVAPLPGEQPEMLVGIWRLKDMSISGDITPKELKNLKQTKARQLKEQQLTLNADGSYILITPVGNQPGNVQNLSGDWSIEDGKVFHVRGNPTLEHYDSYEVLSMDDNNFVYFDTLYRMQNKMIYVRAQDGEEISAADLNLPIKADKVEPKNASNTGGASSGNASSSSPNNTKTPPTDLSKTSGSDVKKGGGSDVKKGGGSDVNKGGSDVKKGGG